MEVERRAGELESGQVQCVPAEEVFRQLDALLLTFEWDPVKALDNERKHGVSFEEALTALPMFRRLPTMTPVVVHVERGDNIRLISVRTADRREAAKYTRSH